MSSTSTVSDILTAARDYTLYVSFVILFGGVFGHVIDILVFTSTKPFQRSPSAFYLTAESIVNCILLLVLFTSRIAIFGFENDLTLTSIVWCKVRQAFAGSITLMSFSIICFAAIDQYLSTSHSPYIKRLSTLKLARILTVIAALTWTLATIPTLILTEIRSSNGCSSYNYGFNIYLTYVASLIFTGLLPMLVSSSFAAFAYLNVRRIVRRQIPIFRRRLERQLTAMILVRVLFFVGAITPFVLDRMYNLQVQVDQNNLLHNAIRHLISAIAYSIFYMNCSVSPASSLRQY